MAVTNEIGFNKEEISRIQAGVADLIAEFCKQDYQRGRQDERKRCLELGDKLANKYTELVLQLKNTTEAAYLQVAADGIYALQRLITEDQEPK